jgi:hypothetical protein
MTEDFFFGWLSGFGGILIGFTLAELQLWWRHIRELRKIRAIERIVPSMIELNRGIVK